MPKHSAASTPGRPAAPPTTWNVPNVLTVATVVCALILIVLAQLSMQSTMESAVEISNATDDAAQQAAAAGSADSVDNSRRDAAIVSLIYSEIQGFLLPSLITLIGALVSLNSIRFGLRLAASTLLIATVGPAVFMLAVWWNAKQVLAEAPFQYKLQIDPLTAIALGLTVLIAVVNFVYHWRRRPRRQD